MPDRVTATYVQSGTKCNNIKFSFLPKFGGIVASD